MNKDKLDGLLFVFADVNFLHVAIVLFLIGTAVLIVVSLLTKTPDRQKLENLTLATTSTIGADVDNKAQGQKRVDLVL
jgi:CHASE1-domain containing sensor protein